VVSRASVERQVKRGAAPSDQEILTGPTGRILTVVEVAVEGVIEDAERNRAAWSAE